MKNQTVTEEISKIPIEDPPWFGQGGDMQDFSGLTPEALIAWAKGVLSLAKKKHYSDLEIYCEYGSGNGDGHYLKARGTRLASKQEIQNLKESLLKAERIWLELGDKKNEPDMKEGPL